MFKRFNAFLVLVLLMASTFNFQTATAASSDPINGATANVDFMYLMRDDEEFVNNYTSELNEDDGDVLRWMDEEFEPEMYYYIGVGSPFDRLYFDIDKGAEYHTEVPDFVWEYNDGGSWKDLDVRDSNIDDFKDEGENYIEFEFDEEWEEAEIMESDAYWVRLSTEEERIEADYAEIDQISARAFTLKLSVEDDRGDEVTGLTESDFDFSDGSDNDIHEFINLGEGDYFLAINADEDDVHYTMTIDDSEFEEESWTVKVSSFLFEFSIELDDEDDDDRDEDEDDDDDDDDRDEEEDDDDDDVNDDGDVIGGATADFDHVFTHNDALRNVTDEASDDDNDEFRLFDDNDGLQYLYMGMDTVFDEIYFDIEEAVDFDGRGDIDWEYYSEDDGWEDLDVDDDELNDFDETGIVMVDFDIPSDWDTHSFNSERAYWVRVSTRDDIDDEGKIEQISARAYTVKIDVEDEDNDKVEDLTKSDFEIDGGTKDVIYGFFEKRDGLYYLALMADARDVSYKITIDDSKYEEETVSVVAKTSARTYDVELEENSRKVRTTSTSSSSSSKDDCEADFRDTWRHYSARAVDELYCMGALEGYTRSYYRPDYRMTRAEFLKLLMLGADIDPEDYSGYEDFRDVNSNDWHYEYVVAALELDMIDDKRYFYPNRYVTRAEAVTMLVRLADLNTYYWETPFSDVPDYAWFAPYVATAYNNFLVRGYSDRSFKPSQVLTRGEGAVMTYNAIQELWD